jgi:signal transduction histidine kinase
VSSLCRECALPAALAHVPEVTAKDHDFWHPSNTLLTSYNALMTEGLRAATAPYCRPIEDSPDITPAVARTFDWFAAAAIGTWIACGLWPVGSIVSGRLTGVPAVLFVMMFAIYGAAVCIMLMLPRQQRQVRRWVPVTLTAVQSVTAIAINADTILYLNGSGMGLGLIVIVAAELPYFLRQRDTWAVIVVQTVVLTAVIGGTISWLELATFALASIGFQMFAAASSILLISEGRARTNLTRANAELSATRELLAETSRTSERLRISRDLHDTLGHHLTALSLQLDVAARLSEGSAVEHVRQAHAITRLLLSDVRDVVSTLRESSRVNLAEAIRTLALQPTNAQVHLDIPEALVLDDPSQAEALLRAVQEILTNVARHARATNLWIQLQPTDGGVALQARDDGQGAESVIWGHGLTGMRERFDEYGGHVDVTAVHGKGFELRAFMPMPRLA